MLEKAYFRLLKRMAEASSGPSKKRNRRIRHQLGLDRTQNLYESSVEDYSHHKTDKRMRLTAEQQEQGPSALIACTFYDLTSSEAESDADDSAYDSDRTVIISSEDDYDDDNDDVIHLPEDAAISEPQSEPHLVYSRRTVVPSLTLEELSNGEALPHSLSERARQCRKVQDFTLPRYSQEDIAKIEEKTRGQSDNPLWFHYRIGCISASCFKTVVLWKGSVDRDNVPVNKVKTVMNYTGPSRDHANLVWERKMEPTAKQIYTEIQHIKGHRGIQVAECGILFHPEMTFIAASPDGLISCPSDCSACRGKDGNGILEIKYPTKDKDHRATAGNPSYLTVSESGRIILDEQHEYYYQVQTQLAVTGRPWCDFFVYKPGGWFLQRIRPLLRKWRSYALQAEHFFLNYIVPELVDRKLQKQMVRTQDVQDHHERVQSSKEAYTTGSRSPSAKHVTTEPSSPDIRFPASGFAVTTGVHQQTIRTEDVQARHERIQSSTKAHTTSSRSSSAKQGGPMQILREAVDLFDQRGGKLTISSHTLNIPSGALISDTRITLKILQDVPDSVHLRADEVIATYAFQCLPSGLRFADGKPVRLTIPHCVNLIDPKKVQTVLYYWSNNEKEENVQPERIVQTTRTCRVTPHNIEITLEHFSGGFLAFIKSWWYTNGKLMSFMPFLPRTLPTSRNTVMEIRMVNKPHNISWKDVHVLDKKARYQPAKDDDDEMIVKEKDLQLSCQIEDNTPLIEDIQSDLLCATTKHTVYFDLNLKDKSNDSLVALKLKQDETEKMIKFRTNFSDAESENSLSSEEEDELDEPSWSSRDNEVPESDLLMLADKIGDNEVVAKLALKLGFKYNKWKAYRRLNKAGGFEGTRDMLFDWKENTPKQEQRSILREALEESGFGEAAGSL